MREQEINPGLEADGLSKKRRLAQLAKLRRAGKERSIGVLRTKLQSGDVKSQNDGFDWREIVCASEDAAKTEAERQQSLDTRDAEWIYLRNTSGLWVARRTPRNWQPPPMSMRRAFLERLTNPFDWLRP